MANDLRSRLEKIIESASPDLRAGYRRDVDLLTKNGIATYQSLCQVVEGNFNVETKQVASWALGRLGGPLAVDSLLRSLEEPELSFEAAKSLILLGDTNSFSRIRRTMAAGEHSRSRAAAAYALGMLGDGEAVDPLAEMLGSSDTVEVRSHAAEALGHLGAKKAVPLLVTTLRDEADEVRFWSAFALGEIADQRAIPELEKLATTDQATIPHLGSVAREARTAIKRIKT